VYEYNALNLLDYPDERLIDSQNPFALVLLAARQMLLKGSQSDEVLLKRKLFVFKELYRRGLFGDQKLKAIFGFLNNYVAFGNPAVNRTFINEAEKIIEKRKNMDIFEQIQELRAEERTRRIVKNLLKQTNWTMERIASMTEASVDFVKEVKRNTE